MFTEILARGRSSLAPVFLILAIGFGSGHADSVVGWRTDGTGRYPDAKPVTEWGPEKNVIWKRPLPGKSNASPVIVGERIFVTSEPFDLICVDAAEGKPLWKHSNDITELLSPSDAAAAIQARDKSTSDTRERVILKGKIRQITRAQAKGEAKPEEVAQLPGLEERLEAVNAKLAPIEKYILPDTQKSNGYSSSVPVSDGKYVYALYGNGVAACYSLDGKRQWLKFIENPYNYNEWGHSSSPVLAGGRLVVHLKDLLGLDPKTGEVVWRVKQEAPHWWGTPATATIKGTEVIISPHGEVVKAEDGSVLTPERFSYSEFNTPVVQDGVVYVMQGKDPRTELGPPGGAFRLPTEANAPLKMERIWTAALTENRYYASPVIHDGLAYAISRAGILTIQDAKTGESVVPQARVNLGADAYPCVALAGGNLYYSGENGVTYVMKKGSSCETVTSNTLEPFRASPVFDGDRMYIRGYQNLYCIGEK